MAKELEIRLRSFTALVDDEDFEWASQHKWYAVEGRKTTYVMRLWYENGQRKSEYLHRAILGATKGQETDHINHNGLDCRRENLRLCSRAQNAAHSTKTKIQKVGLSRYKGVRPTRYNWRAQISKAGRREDLGVYTTEMEAAVAYDIAARRLHGEYAECNFLDNPLGHIPLPICSHRGATLKGDSCLNQTLYFRVTIPEMQWLLSQCASGIGRSPAGVVRKCLERVIGLHIE